MKKIWINKAKTFKEAQDFDRNYYYKMSSSERLEIMQFLRNIYSKFEENINNESRKRLRRVVKIIQ